MNRMFYSLPDEGTVGLKWREYRKARANVERIERRLHDAQNERAHLEQEIRALGEKEVRELAQAILEGTDDPTASHGEHEKLVASLGDLRREEQAVSQALPQAEEELRQVVYENQHRWKEEADASFEKAIAAEHKAYQRALELIEEPRRRRIYAELLARWVRSVEGSFGEPSDVAARSAIARLEGDAAFAEEKFTERAELEASLWQEAEAERQRRESGQEAS